MIPEIQLKTVISDSFQIAQIFRNQLLLKPNTAAQGAFTGSTLQGEEAPSGPRPNRYPIYYRYQEDIAESSLYVVSMNLQLPQSDEERPSIEDL